MANSETASRSSVDDHVGNLTAVDAISERLAEVTRLAEKLDERLYEAGARIRNASRQISEQVNETPSIPSNCDGVTREETEKSDRIDEREENIVKIGDNEVEESFTEDYATATECTTTPMGRSRSESFVTMSECDDGLASLVNEFSNARRQAATVSTRGNQESEILSAVRVPEEDKLIVAKNLSMAETMKENGAAGSGMERTSSSSIIEKVEEKSGKIMKEVTETTTLRVSHDTRFGVASYKLTSNTLREAYEHADVKGILDLKGFGVKTNGYSDDKLSQKDDFSTYNREELSLSEINASPCKSEIENPSKFTKMIRESSQREEISSQMLNDNNNVTKSIPFGLESRGNNDSGIEITQHKNSDFCPKEEETEDLELLNKLKEVSRSQVAVEKNSMITSLRTIH